MAERDAFTAGVRPGGLNNSTEIRLLLCYLVQHSGPITQQQLEAGLMDAQLVNYFEIGSCLDDIKRLRDMGLYGAIIGKAYYAGTIDLAEAVKEAGDQC